MAEAGLRGELRLASGRPRECRRQLEVWPKEGTYCLRRGAEELRGLLGSRYLEAYGEPQASR